MIRTDINHNIDDYNSGIANGLSARMGICFLLAAIVIVMAVLLISAAGLPMVLAGWIGAAPAAGCVLIGIKQKEGYHLEEIIADRIFVFRLWKCDFEADELENAIATEAGKKEETAGKDRRAYHGRKKEKLQ